jgi:transposase
VKTITGWLARRPDHLHADEQQQLTRARQKCEHLDRLAGHVTGFAKILSTGHEHLDDWLARVEADDLPELHTLARGIRADHAAVLNGMSLLYSSGR